MPAAHHRRVTFVAGKARLRGPGRHAELDGELLVVDDDDGQVVVVGEGRDEADDLRISGARRVGDALLWRNDEGELLSVVGTVHAYDAHAPLWAGRRGAQRPTS